MARAQQAIVQRLMETHDRKWIDESLPMFGGRSPRQMAKVDPDAVSRSIWEICNRPPGVRYDASWMCEELAVRRLGHDRFEPGLEVD